MKIGFIGAGNMAQAIIKGFLSAQTVRATDIMIHGGHAAHYAAFAEETGVQTSEDNLSVVAFADVLFLAIPPKAAGTILDEITPALDDQMPLISMLTGVSLADLSADITKDQVPLVRIMPNVNVAINEGMTAYATNEAGEQKLPLVLPLLTALGKVTPLAERDFSTFVALAGSAPAFIYLFIDSLARAGVKYGLPKSQADEIVAQTVLGSAKNVLTSSDSPFDLIDQVSSPGGSTIAGLLAMQKAGLVSAVVDGVDATVAKDPA